MLMVRSELCGRWHESSCLGIEPMAKSVRHDSEGYYELLGVSPYATDDEVKRAGRAMLMQTHPDLGGDKDEFEKVAKAYKILSNASSRAEYNNVTRSVKTHVRNDSVVLPKDDMWAGEPVWYKEPVAILGSDAVGRVRTWHEMLLDAARDFRQSLEIKAGVCRCPAGYGEIDDIAVIDVDVVPERWAAEIYVLKRMCENA